MKARIKDIRLIARVDVTQLARVALVLGRVDVA